MGKAMIETVTKMVLLTEIIPDPEQLARHALENIKGLAGDMDANGLHQAIGAMESKRLIYGHGRYAAAKFLGWNEIETKIYLGNLSSTQWMTIRATENLHRTDLSGYQRWQSCLELLRLNPGWKCKDLADHLHLDPGMITRILSPSRCIAEWQQALRAEQVSIADCYAVYRADEGTQQRLLEAKLSGASAAEVSQRARKARNGNGKPAVHVTHLKIPFGKYTVVLSGEQLGMVEVVEILAELLKEARKSAEHFDVKTWQAMMRDKSGG